MRLQTSRSRYSKWVTRFGALAAAVLFSIPVAAQTTGTITGSVVDKSGRAPLNGVQVSVDGTQRGALTDARGRYTISGVPAGARTVRVTYIGYRTETQPV